MHAKQEKPDAGREVLRFFEWAYKNGASMAAELDYVRAAATFRHQLPDLVDAVVDGARALDPERYEVVPVGAESPAEPIHDRSRRRPVRPAVAEDHRFSRDESFDACADRSVQHRRSDADVDVRQRGVTVGAQGRQRRVGGDDVDLIHHRLPDIGVQIEGDGNRHIRSGEIAHAARDLRLGVGKTIGHHRPVQGEHDPVRGERRRLRPFRLERFRHRH